MVLATLLGLGEPPEGTPLQHLAPASANGPYHLSDGRRRFRHRIMVSPAVGRLGGERLFALRVGYNPNSWLGYEASVGHNPGTSVHALFHSVNAVLRYPVPGRIQPYVEAGYGMMLVYPGRLLRADPVTKNTLSAGGGVELYVRDDVSLRLDGRWLTILGPGGNRDGTAVYNYGETTVGFNFYRTVGQ